MDGLLVADVTGGQDGTDRDQMLVIRDTVNPPSMDLHSATMQARLDASYMMRSSL